MPRGDAMPDGLNNTNGWNNTKLLINEENSNSNYDQQAGWVVSVNESSKADVKFNFSASYKKSYLAAMSRNRDTNDDGKISDNELKWYVPARNQCIALWLGDNNLGSYRPYNATNLKMQQMLTVRKAFYSPAREVTHQYGGLSRERLLATINGIIKVQFQQTGTCVASET